MINTRTLAALLLTCSTASAQVQHLSDMKDPKVIRDFLSQLYGGDPNVTFVSLRSATGDVATGVVLKRTNEAITIDTTPCSKNKKIVTFVSPYKESQLGDATCAEKSYPRVQVLQLGSGWK